MVQEERPSPWRLGWDGLVLLLERVGIECAPLGGAAAMVPAEVTQCLMDVVCYCSVHHGEQMAPGQMEPLPV